jgi:hypothetical protein
VNYVLFVLVCVLLSSCNQVHESEQRALRRLVQDTSQALNDLGFDVDVDEVLIDIRNNESMTDYFKALDTGSRPGVDDFSLKVVSDKKQAFNESDNSRLAFYDPNSQVIIFKEGALTRITPGYLAHELAHVFQDQKWGFDSLWKAYKENPSRENYNIINFMIEGHAELVRQAFEQSESQPKDKKAIGFGLSKIVDTDCLVCGKTNQVDSLPYKEGLRFFLHQYQKGSWGQVERNMTHMPSSSEQILHPNKLSRDEPTPVSLPLWSGDTGRAKLIMNTTMGEAFLLNKLLSLGIPAREAFLSASGWDGDAAHIYRFSDGKEVLLWRILFDREEDARQLELSINKSGMPKNILKRGRTVDWILTESPELLKGLRTFMSKNPFKIPTSNSEDQKSTMENELNASRVLGFRSFYPKSSIVIGPRQ